MAFTTTQRLAHGLAALLCFSLALGIIMQTGLPERAQPIGKLSKRAAPELGQPAPIFRLPAVSGETISLMQGGYAYTLLYFWSSSCAPCRNEMPKLDELQRSQPLNILAVNMGESAETVRAWVDQLSLSYTVLLDPALAVARAYQIRGLPSAFLLDAQYRIIRIDFGPLRINQLQRELAGAAHG